MNEFDVFMTAVEKDRGDLEAYLSEVCSGNPDLRQRIDALLKAYQEPSLLDYLTENAADSIPKIQGYDVLEQIGEGAFGNVYMAEQVVPVRRRVAVKVLKLGMDTKQVVARFDAERQAMAMMDHPSIASVFDAGATESGRPYFVMELVRGESITTFCDSERFDTRQRLNLVASVCRAIQHAHQKGIIHRDIKPSNVMVTNHDGKALAKIIDFGIAKATEEPLTDKTMFTRFRQMVGTPAYMSPEQAASNASDVDTRSDIYSVGVLLYELLTGKPPLDLHESSYEQILREIRETDPPSMTKRVNSFDAHERSTVSEKRRATPAELSRTVSGELNWIVIKALSKDRTRRYGTAAAFADDIDRYLNNQPVLASPPSTTYKLVKFVRRNWLMVAASTAVLLALVAGLTIAILGQRTASVQAIVAENEREKAEKMFDILRDLLLAVHAGPDYTVRESLDDFVETLPTRFDGSMPEVEAEIYSIIGNTFGSMTFDYDAERFFRKAVELRESVTPTDYQKLAEAHSEVAHNAKKRCQPNQAQKSINQAIAAYQNAKVDPPQDLRELEVDVQALIELDQQLRSFEQDKQELKHQEILREVESALKNSPDMTGGTTWVRAVFLLLDFGEYKTVIELCKRSPSDFSVKYSDQKRNIRALLNSILMITYREHGQPELAHEMAALVRADADGDEKWFAQNPWQENCLANALLEGEDTSTEDIARALKLSAKHWGLVKAMWEGMPSSNVATACHAYAVALDRSGEPERAKDVLKSGLGKVPKSSPFARGILEREYAKILEKTGGDARAILHEAKRWREELAPEFDVQRSVAEMNLAKFLSRVDRDVPRAVVEELLQSASDRIKDRPEDDYFRSAVEDVKRRIEANENQ